MQRETTSPRRTGPRLAAGLAAGLLLCAAAESGLAGLYDAWAYTATIRFNGYTKSETLINFPALVVLSNNCFAGFAYSQMQSGANDLAFTDDTGLTSLDHEIESWNPDGVSYVWVRVPTLAQNTAIKVWWGAAGQSAPPCTTDGSTWPAEFGLVEHMSVDNGTTVADATANRRTATIVNEYAYTSSGAVGGALNLTRTADRNNGLQLVSTVPLGSAWTISCWYKDLLGTGDWRTLTRGPTANHQVIVDENSYRLGSYIGGFKQFGSATLPGDAVGWQHLTVVGAGGSTTAYVNGQPVGTGAFQSTEDVKAIGYYQGGSQKFANYLDEFRIETNARSAAWIWATYQNMAANGAFQTYGPVIARDTPFVINRPVSGVTTTTAQLNGTLASTGTSATAVSVYWGPTDQSTNGIWAQSSTWDAPQNPGDFSFLAEDLAPDSDYYYTYSAENANGTVWAAPSQYFITGELTAQATDDSCGTNAGDTATFTITRPAACTGGPLTVNYTLGGTAVNGVDYTAAPASGALTIPAGETTATVTITPVPPGNYREPKSIVLTLADGPYAVSPAANSAGATLQTVMLPPVVSNAGGASALTVNSATLNGLLTDSASAHAYIYWGTDSNNWGNVIDVGTVTYQTPFSANVANLLYDTPYYYRCDASNDYGAAWAPTVASFVCAPSNFTWTGAADNNWNNQNNWNPSDAFPCLARQVACFSNGNATVYLNLPSVTIGVLNLTPNNWSTGWNITTNGDGQALVFDNGAAPARINLLDGRWAGSIITAPVVLTGDAQVYARTAENRYELTLRGPVTGEGKLIVMAQDTGRVKLDPLRDMVYEGNRFAGAGAIMKGGARKATLTGTNAVALAGDWGGRAAISGGGQLIISGGIFTNLINSTRGLLFGSAGNALIVTNGGALIQAYSGSSPQCWQAGNLIAVTGAGSLWDVHGDAISMNAPNNRFVINNGGQVRNARGQIGWNGSTNNIATVDGAGSLWNAGGQIGVGGQGSRSNLLAITRGGVVSNTWLWLGGYMPYDGGGGAYNRLLIADGGKLYTGRDDGWGWGSCIGCQAGSAYQVVGNSALITGTGSVWNAQGRMLRVGYPTESSSTALSNSVRVEAGGLVTNVSTLCIGSTKNNTSSFSNTFVVAVGGAAQAGAVVVGDAGATGNALVLSGGALNAGSLTVNAANALAPVIGSAGLTPAGVSGTATFAAGSLLRPGATPDAPLGTCTVLVADHIVDNGLALDPAADAGHWSFKIDGNVLVLRYKKPGTCLFLR